MVKYEEKEQGKYIQKTLISEQSKKTPAKAIECNANLYKEVVELMEEKGAMIAYEKTRDRRDGYRDKNYSRSESFYVNGVGVGVLRIKHAEGEREGKEFEYRNATRITLATENSDSLDNVVEMILDKFPAFKEVDFSIF